MKENKDINFSSKIKISLELIKKNCKVVLLLYFCKYLLTLSTKIIVKNTILVPIDFSEQSIIALEQSYNLAKLSQSSITLLNVIKTGSSFWGIFSDNEKKDYEIKIEQKLKQTAKDVEEEIGIEVGTIIRRGKVSEEILRVAEYLSPQLIVMGTSSGINISRKIVGSRTLHIIKTSKYPIMSVKGKEHSHGCENILLPIDATKETVQKVDFAINLASLFKSKITVVSAISKSKKKQLEAINSTLNEIKKRIEDSKIICDIDTLQASDNKDTMAIEIIGFANKVNADLIIIMTQQEKGLSEFFLGSLARNIIFSSDIPVLTTTPNHL